MHDLGAASALAVVGISVLAIAAVAALVALEDRSWRVRVGVAFAASASVAAFGSTQVTFWFLSSVVLAAWAAGAPPFPVRSHPPRPSILGIAVLAVLASARVGPGWWAPARFALVGAAALALTSARPGLLPSAARASGRTVQRLSFTVLGLVAVVVPGLARRIVPDRSLGAPRGRRGWRDVDGADVASERPWAPTHESPSLARTLAGAGAAMAVLVVGIGLAARSEDRGASPRSSAASAADRSPAAAGTTTSTTVEHGSSATTTATSTPPVPAAFTDSPWYPKYAADSAYANRWLDSFRLAGYNKLRDGHMEGSNVVDGARVSWEPPSCTCPHVTLWMYGSATTYGFGQRDEHTIASELARLAWADGVHLEVVNRGVPGDPYWRAADRFAWDVTSGSTPDIVVFDSGVSDLNAAIWLNQRGWGDDDWPHDQMAVGFLEDPVISKVIDDGLQAGRTQPPLPSGVEVSQREPATPLDPEGIGELAAKRYTESLPMGLDVAKRHGVDAFTFWEPMRLSRPVVAGEPTFSTDHDLQVSVRSAAAHLPASVIDLAHAFDGNHEPIYFDDVHYNELGARLVAEAMYEHLRPTIESRAAASEGSP